MIQTVALFSKPDSPQAWGVLNEVVSWCRRKGLDTIVAEGASGGWTGSNWDPAFCADVRQRADLAVAIGGDGTLLGVARSLFGSEKPLLGINLGHLGYLTDIAAKDIEAALTAVKAGDYILEDRILLSAHINGSTEGALAFNDVVLSKGDTGRLVDFDVFVDGHAVFSLRADGLIISTPTGSTAYSLSANGPILHPALAAVAVVPLNPHSLTARPITLPSQAKIEVVARGDSPSRIYCDGVPFGEVLTEGNRVAVTQGETTVKMLHLKDYSLFKTLQQKLSWATPRER